MSKPITVAEVTERLGVSENLVYGWVASGEPVHLRFGSKGKRGAIRIEQEALEAFVFSRRQGDGKTNERTREAGTSASSVFQEI